MGVACGVGAGVWTGWVPIVATAGAGATATEAVRGDAAVASAGGVPAPSKAGLTRNGGSGSAAAEPAASSIRIAGKAGPNCPRREVGMPNRSVSATLMTGRETGDACRPPEMPLPADALGEVPHEIWDDGFFAGELIGHVQGPFHTGRVNIYAGKHILIPTFFCKALSPHQIRGLSCSISSNVRRPVA